MFRLEISSDGCLAVSRRAGCVGLFTSLNWQYLDIDLIECEQNFIRFSPNGQLFLLNRSNEQICIYKKTNHNWISQNIISVDKPLVALDLTDRYLFLADICGDIYEIDLLVDQSSNCILRTSLQISNLLVFQFLVFTDQQNRICVHHYPNTSRIQGYCLGHTNVISQLKLLNHNCLLSASLDGTIRLWSLPDCKPLLLFHSKAFSCYSKEIFYKKTSNYSQVQSIPVENPSDNYSIWKLALISTSTDVYLAFSIFTRSIYLTSLVNLEQLTNKERKIRFDVNYGQIIDYQFDKTELVILFDRKNLLKLDVPLILSSNQTELFFELNASIQQINLILQQNETHFRKRQITEDEQQDKSNKKKNSACTFDK